MMSEKKIAVMSFYESNARYTGQLAQVLLERTGMETVQLCMYPSARNYCRRHHLTHIYLPEAVRQCCDGEVNDIPYSFYRFHVRLFPHLEARFRRIARQYWQYYAHHFPWNEYSTVVFIGDRRLFSSVGAFFARQHGVSVLFFEPGPFGTLIFDPQGVNCNMSVAKTSLEEMREYLREQDMEALFRRCTETVTGQKYYENSIGAYLRKTGDILQSIPPIFLRGLCYPELFTGESFLGSLPYLMSRLPLSRNQQTPTVAVQTPYIFVALQVPGDVQVIENSEFFSSVDDMLFSVMRVLPAGYQLIVREHPMNKGRYGKALYQAVHQHAHVHIDNKTGINTLIDGAALVIVINSTVGLEAAVRGAAVLTLGKSYYARIVNTLTSRDELEKAIRDSVGRKANPEEIRLFMAYLFARYLTKDNYRNREYQDLENAASRLCGR